MNVTLHEHVCDLNRTLHSVCVVDLWPTLRRDALPDFIQQLGHFRFIEVNHVQQPAES